MDKKLAEWFAGNDTGLSSEALALFLAAGVPSQRTPSDSGDFGRCFRLLKHMGWESRIGEAAAASGQWAALVEIWPAITAAYEAEDHPGVYRLIKSVEADGYERDGYKVDRREDGSMRSAVGPKGFGGKIDLGNGVSMGFGR